MAWTGAAIGAAGSIAGGLLGGSGAKKASKAQAKATKAAIAESQRQNDVSRIDLAPWRDSGSAAIKRLGDLMGIGGGSTTGNRSLVPVTDENITAEGYLEANPDLHQSPLDAANPVGHYYKYKDLNKGRMTYVTDPVDPAANSDYGSLNKKFTLADFWDDPVTQASYQQGLDQGTKALGNIAGARGNRNSGAQLKALTRFSTDYTGNQAAGSQARYVGDQTNLYNRLAGIAGSGQTAVNTGVQAGQNTANTVSGLLTSQGNARGAAAISRGNAIGGAIQNVGNIFANQSGGQFNPNASYNAAGQFTPFYAGYDSGGGNAYG